MSTHVPLTPQLEQFVREQLATGRYQSETEVIRAALHLLEEQSSSREAASTWLKQELDRGLNSPPSKPITKAFWQDMRNRLDAETAPNNES